LRSCMLRIVQSSSTKPRRRCGALTAACSAARAPAELPTTTAGARTTCSHRCTMQYDIVCGLMLYESLRFTYKPLRLVVVLVC
jgi:hypothetical protein